MVPRFTQAWVTPVRVSKLAQSHKREAGPTMEKLRFVGLDVHKESIAISVADEGGGEPASLCTIPHDCRVLLKHLRKLGRVKCCYEAGPTGFGLHRELKASGVDCVVVAPSLVPQCAGDRVMTDRRDATKMPEQNAMERAERQAAAQAVCVGADFAGVGEKCAA